MRAKATTAGRVQDVVAEAGGVTYTLRVGTNALCRLEDYLDKGVSSETFLIQLVAEANAKRVRMANVRRLLWAALADHHPAISEQEAGRVMDDLGGPGVVADLLAKPTEAVLVRLLR